MTEMKCVSEASHVPCGLCSAAVKVAFPVKTAVCDECVSEHGPQQVIDLLHKAQNDALRQLRHDIRDRLQVIALQSELMMRVNDPVQRAKAKGSIDRALQAIGELLAPAATDQKLTRP